MIAKLLKMWWPGTESNRRRQPFQGCALPTELPGRITHCRDRPEILSTTVAAPKALPAPDASNSLIRRRFGPGLQTTIPSGGTPAGLLPSRYQTAARPLPDPCRAAGQPPYQPATRPSLRGSVPPISTPRFQSIWIA